MLDLLQQILAAALALSVMLGLFGLGLWFVIWAWRGAMSALGL